MNKILWAILFFCLYVYVTTSGDDNFVVERGRALYAYVCDWFEDADVDFHLKKTPEKKARKRWW